jgi:hypothetical protein
MSPVGGGSSGPGPAPDSKAPGSTGSNGPVP